MFRPCYLFLLWNVIITCLAFCLTTVIAACFFHLYTSLTCSSVHASSLHPLLAHHHRCYVDVYCVLFCYFFCLFFYFCYMLHFFMTLIWCGLCFVRLLFISFWLGWSKMWIPHFVCHFCLLITVHDFLCFMIVHHPITSCGYSDSVSVARWLKRMSWLSVDKWYFVEYPCWISLTSNLNTPWGY